MPLPQVDTQKGNKHLNLPPLPDKQREDTAFTRFWHETQRVLQERDAEIERRLRALEEA